MIRLNAIPLDVEPLKKILPKLPRYVSPSGVPEPEMCAFDSAFLCGVMKQFRPKKILEVGVAGGATTAIILQALEDFGAPYEMYSLDIAERYHLDATKPTGFLGTFAKEKIFGDLRGKHEFHIGKFLPQVIDEIGGDIDCVILDTAHILPGEVFDFLAVLPYLKPNAVVVLHDVTENQRVVEQQNLHATTVLFSAVTANKFLNFQPDNDIFRHPNIAAFQINEQTAANIENVFLTLILRWSYLPSQEELLIYRRHLRRFYPDEPCEIFQEAIDMNAYNFYRAQRQ